jgi:hypothetical protein
MCKFKTICVKYNLHNFVFQKFTQFFYSVDEIGNCGNRFQKFHYNEKKTLVYGLSRSSFII